MADARFKYLYVGIRVRDLGRSLRFYAGLGFQATHRGTMYHGGAFVQLRAPGSRAHVELNWYPRGSEFFEPWRKGTEFDHFGFWVDDVDAAVRRVRRFGGRVATQLPRERTPGTRHLSARDPDGNWLELMGPWPKARDKRRAR
jgi:catechol 2,3-dioxygenase-like lactoylglutathione lyase family enzyme